MIDLWYFNEMIWYNTKSDQKKSVWEWKLRNIAHKYIISKEMEINLREELLDYSLLYEKLQKL